MSIMHLLRALGCGQSPAGQWDTAVDRTEPTLKGAMGEGERGHQIERCPIGPCGPQKESPPGLPGALPERIPAVPTQVAWGFLALRWPAWQPSGAETQGSGGKRKGVSEAPHRAGKGRGVPGPPGFSAGRQGRWPQGLCHEVSGRAVAAPVSACSGPGPLP